MTTLTLPNPDSALLYIYAGTNPSLWEQATGTVINRVPAQLQANIDAITTYINTEVQLISSGFSFSDTAGLGFTASGVLSLAQLGGWGQFQASGLTIGLPSLVTATPGNTFTFLGGSVGGWIQGHSSDIIQGSSTPAANLLFINPGQVTTVTVDGTAGWFVTSDGFGPVALGQNQTLQVVTGSRSLGATYTNTSLKPILVYVSSISSSTAWGFTGYLNGYDVCNSYVPTSGSQVSIFLTVPAGAEYEIAATSGSPTVLNWLEYS